MATNAGEVRVTLTAISRQFTEALRQAINQMQQLRREAERTNRVLGQRTRLPLRNELTSITAQLRNLRAQAGGILASFPAGLPPTFRQSITQASRGLRGLRAESGGIRDRFSQTFNQISTQGTQAFGGASRGARNLSREIDRGNRSITLMVAKFALLTFAVQTAATIINSTFGAALRSIDDFEQGIIGTAAAITNIADLSAQPGATLADAFTQNLAFVRGAFQELEVIAGNFFSSASDLQLAFNTLAARGVVIRREEFTTLGLITDQIKIQTRGQVSSIQIAQELRNLFTGQVRAADQLAQLIRAQGGDVEEVARQLRETGSLEALEPFVAGLREALGVIQGLLIPQIVRFLANVEQITRLTFADTFTGTVSILRSINDFLTENKVAIGVIANIVFNRVATAFRVVRDIIAFISPLLAVIAGQSLVRIVTLAAGFVARFLTVQRLVLSIVVATAQWASEFEIVRNTVSLVFNAYRLLFNLVVRGFDTILDQVNALIQRLGSFPVVGDAFRNISQGIDGANNFIERLNESLEGSADQAGESTGRIQEFIDSIKDFATVSQEEIGRTIVRLSKEIADAPFPTSGAIQPDEDGGRTADLLRRILEAQRRLRELEARRNLQVDINAIEARRNVLAQGLAEQTILERDAFQERRELLQRETALQIQAIEDQIATQNELARAQRDRIISDSNIGDLERAQQIELLNLQTSQRIVRLDQQRLVAQQRLNDELAQQNVELANARRTLDRLLQDQAFAADNFFVTTVGESLDQLIIDQRRRLQDLQRENPSLTNADLDQLAELDRLEQTQTAIATPLNAALQALDQAFRSLVDGIVDGSADFRDLARNIGRTLLQGGLQDLFTGLKDAVSDGLTNIFSGLSNEAAQQAAAALAAGIGLLFAVLSRSGNDGSFTSTGAGGAGTGLASSAPVRGIIGGSTSIPIAEINTGLEEALIPTNNILTQIERNTRAFAGLNIGLTPEDIAATITAQINDLFDQANLNP